MIQHKKSTFIFLNIFNIGYILQKNKSICILLHIKCTDIVFSFFFYLNEKKKNPEAVAMHNLFSTKLIRIHHTKYTINAHDKIIKFQSALWFDGVKGGFVQCGGSIFAVYYI